MERELSLTGLISELRPHLRSGGKPWPLSFQAGVVWTELFEGEDAVDRFASMLGVSIPIRDMTGTIDFSVFTGYMFQLSNRGNGTWVVQPGFSIDLTR